MSLLEIRKVNKTYVREDFLGRDLGKVEALRQISLTIERGEILALVGESGSGKSTLAKIVCGMEEATSGSLIWNSRRSNPAQMVFQNPYESLNPRLSVGFTIREALAHTGLKRNRRESRMTELLSSVGLPDINRTALPHQFSGGQQQRLAIARALALNPELLICDEAVSALDISVQAQILTLLKEINRESKLPILFIAHDLEAVSMVASRIAVMKEGGIVEVGDVREIIHSPVKEYTRRLIEAVPINPWIKR